MHRIYFMQNHFNTHNVVIKIYEFMGRNSQKGLEHS